MLPRLPHDPNSGPLPARLTAMAFRFVARQICSKPLALRNTRPMVSFTFDDVPASACETGARILEQRGGRGTFYVAAEACGTAGAPGEPSRASIDQLRKVWVNGHEIGCHTYSHTAVRSVSLSELDSELDRNQAALKKINGNLVVRNFAYPYGDMSVRKKRHLEARFTSCRSGHAGINAEIADLGALHAWPLQNASIDRAKLAELMARTVQSCGWLIFYSHDVAEQPSKFGVSPDLLDAAVSMAKQAGCALTTVAQAIELITDRAYAEPLCAASS
jgi:peptidoglycan/xylan/chitin deacetylase (PgdA/CDA1 family)